MKNKNYDNKKNLVSDSNMVEQQEIFNEILKFACVTSHEFGINEKKRYIFEKQQLLQFNDYAIMLMLRLNEKLQSVRSFVIVMKLFVCAE